MQDSRRDVIEAVAIYVCTCACGIMHCLFISANCFKLVSYKILNACDKTIGYACFYTYTNLL